ncbi:acyl-homoserine-lactone synthase [Acidithiobacillus thiooxidans]|uniref:Acyl-homoserine-lactone synthase n=1 Tax=Acidithiobacillus thiooxidans ATCC 19377 TaxID=637390 RepID=A0A543PYJ4_ACITH|nr:acyl-homoserine-lactone synthase [Acidithiobacillus thiooxidans]MDX5935763.1 acyl-homoserine-lactone synthase [Acidithiobacillus thiooxidans]TQN49145.1 Acyl-homoserine-lactone synthase [Acidithiobacillus thiooxidans ATCC 19377]
MQILSGTSESLPKYLMSEVAEYRHQVFVERLGWSLQTENNMEIDQFDHPETVYVIVQGNQGEITGCARLLPTTGPYLLGEVFPQLLNSMPLPCTPEIWELSRFATGRPKNPGACPEEAAGQMVRILLEKSIACAAGYGAKKLITVTSLPVERLLVRYGFRSHRAGAPTSVGDEIVVARWIELSEK